MLLHAERYDTIGAFFCRTADHTVEKSSVQTHITSFHGLIVRDSRKPSIHLYPCRNNKRSGTRLIGKNDIGRIIGAFRNPHLNTSNISISTRCVRLLIVNKITCPVESFLQFRFASGIRPRRTVYRTVSRLRHINDSHLFSVDSLDSGHNRLALVYFVCPYIDRTVFKTVGIVHIGLG